MKEIASYPDAMQAHFARTRLEAEGIRAVVLDEHSTMYIPLQARGMESVKVAVRAEDAQRAAEILDRTAATYKRHCPRCDSVQVQRVGPPEFLALIVFAFTLGLLRPKRRCDDCLHEWRE